MLQAQRKSLKTGISSKVAVVDAATEGNSAQRMDGPDRSSSVRGEMQRKLSRREMWQPREGGSRFGPNRVRQSQIHAYRSESAHGRSSPCTTEAQSTGCAAAVYR